MSNDSIPLHRRIEYLMGKAGVADYMKYLLPLLKGPNAPTVKKLIQKHRNFYDYDLSVFLAKQGFFDVLTDADIEELANNRNWSLLRKITEWDAWRVVKAVIS